MYLRNWEHNATSGTPISGAVVEARAATLTSPNTGPVVASTTTNADGMWEFPSLAESTHDIKITYTGNVWWHKGLTKHNVDYIYYTTPMPVTDNFFRNAGFEDGPAGPWTVTNVQQAVFGSWLGLNGVGSSAALSRELTTKSADSLVAAKVIQTRVSGSLQLFQNFIVPASMRGKQLSVSFQVHQSIANAVRPYISDTGGNSFGATSATTGSFVTLTSTRTIDAAATVVQAGIYIDVSATVYVDNAIWSLGAIAATYRPEYFSAYSLTNDLLATDAVDTRVIAALAIGTAELQDDAVTLAKMANNSVGTAELVDANVTTAKVADAAITDVKMANQKVNRAGDSITGHLIMANNFVFRGYRADGTTQENIGFVNASNQVQLGATPLNLLLTGNALFFFDGVGIRTLWHDNNDGAGSGLDADLLDGQQGAFYQARANHTGTQAPSTISPQGAGSALDADTLDGVQGAGYATAGHSHAVGDATTLDGIDSTGFLKIAQGGSNQSITFNSGSVRIGENAGDLVGGAHTGRDGLYVSGDFAVTGVKSRIATGRDGQRGAFHALESPEPYFEEFGRARLVDGEGHVPIPADFANYVGTDDYFVTVMPEAASLLYIAEKRPDAFVVRSFIGDRYAPFTWQVIARQIDLEPTRHLVRL